MGNWASVYLVGDIPCPEQTLALDKEACRTLLNFPGVPASARVVSVAVFDTGMLKRSQNCVPPSTNPVTNDHGTHVAGILSFFVGCHQIRLVDYPVLRDGTWNWQSTYLTSLRHALESGVDVINLSMVERGYSAVVEAFFAECAARGTVVVCAAGNEGDANAATAEYRYPATYPSVISVGSVGWRDTQWAASCFSNSNDLIDFAMPGERILSTGKRAVELVEHSGTSMACPMLASIVCWIILQRNIPRNKDRVSRVRRELVQMCALNSVRTLDERQVGAGMPSWPGKVKE